MLIAAVLPIMTLYRLPQGQYGYSGHVINLPQDVASFASSLPRHPAELDVIVVRREGSAQSHRDFRVRRSVVLGALQWLVTNNVYYSNIRIDDDILQQLPQDGNLLGLCTFTLPGLFDQESSSSQDPDDPYDAHLSRSFVPSVHRRRTESELVRQVVHSEQSTQSTPWPAAGAAPINEFTTEGYITCAFPTLFPTGSGDFLAPRIHTVTAGNYFKHLMMYQDGRFAKHPRFRYFALNTEMRWRALQAGRVYVHQHPNDARLSVDELRDMVGREGEAFSNRVLHYASSIRGTRQYWFKQRSRLISMVDTIGLPTVFFTHSAADNQWPELAQLICTADQDSSSGRAKAVIENPAISDWFFSHRIQKFIEAFYVGVLGATDYWFRFEWQHRGSPHVHGVAWFPDTPDAQQLLAEPQASDGAKAQHLDYADKVVSTTNPAVRPDGSDVDSAPPAQTNPHVCNKPYAAVQDFNQDLIDLIATCQRHTRCSASYCLRTKNGQQKCRFGYPQPLQPQSCLITEDGQPKLLTARNDGLINSHNPVQLSAWRANVDMQYIVSRHRVLEYCAKYATKCEPRSETLKDIFAAIVRSLRDDSTSSVRAAQRLLINSVGDRDYSAQETCHLILQLPMFRASRDFVVLSLDGSHAVEDHLSEDQPATAASTLDHYVARPNSPLFSDMTLLDFTRRYTMPKELGSDPNARRKAVVVIVRPFCSPDPSGPKYEQYCRQKLMLHVAFRQQNELLGQADTYAAAYAVFLRCGSVPSTLEDDIFRLDQLNQQTTSDDAEVRIHLAVVCVAILIHT